MIDQKSMKKVSIADDSEYYVYKQVRPPTLCSIPVLIPGIHVTPHPTCGVGCTRGCTTLPLPEIHASAFFFHFTDLCLWTSGSALIAATVLDPVPYLPQLPYFPHTPYPTQPALASAQLIARVEGKAREVGDAALLEMLSSSDDAAGGEEAEAGPSTGGGGGGAMAAGLLRGMLADYHTHDSMLKEDPTEVRAGGRWQCSGLPLR